MELLKALFLLLLCPARAIDNGLGLTPPRGWRSCKLPRELHYVTQNLAPRHHRGTVVADDHVAYYSHHWVLRQGTYSTPTSRLRSWRHRWRP
eukprot:COSAG02_NODE_3195_length_7193_cov_1.529462_5_plen_92_part_00